MPSSRVLSRCPAPARTGHGSAWSPPGGADPPLTASHHSASCACRAGPLPGKHRPTPAAPAPRSAASRRCSTKHKVSPGQLTLHAGRGGPMKAKATALLLADLGATRSHNRPHTSNDNPFTESHFNTLKYQPRFPQRFGCIEDAKQLLPPVLRLVQSAASPCRDRRVPSAQRF